MTIPSYSSTLFPDVIGQVYRRNRVFRTISSPRDTASDQAKQLNGTNVLQRFTLGWDPLSLANAEAIYHAHEFMGGDWTGLDFFEWETLAWTNRYIGLGDGTAADITLPVKGASSGTTTIRLNGTPIAGTFNAGAGVNGKDTFTPSVFLTLGATIRADFTGRLCRNVTEEEGTSLEMELTRKMNAGSLMWVASISLIETSGTDQL